MIAISTFQHSDRYCVISHMYPTARAVFASGGARKNGGKCGEEWGKDGDNNAQTD